MRDAVGADRRHRQLVPVRAAGTLPDADRIVVDPDARVDAEQPGATPGALLQVAEITRVAETGPVRRVHDAVPHREVPDHEWLEQPPERRHGRRNLDARRVGTGFDRKGPHGRRAPVTQLNAY